MCSMLVSMLSFFFSLNITLLVFNGFYVNSLSAKPKSKLSGQQEEEFVTTEVRNKSYASC